MLGERHGNRKTQVIRQGRRGMLCARGGGLIGDHSCFALVTRQQAAAAAHSTVQYSARYSTISSCMYGPLGLVGQKAIGGRRSTVMAERARPRSWMLNGVVKRRQQPGRFRITCMAL